MLNASFQRKARDSNPHLPCGRTALAMRPGQPYPATFRASSQTGVEPANTRYAMRSLCLSLRTRSDPNGGSGCRTRRSRLMRLQWALAHPRRNSNRQMTKGRVELPSPQGARRSERRVSTGCTTWPRLWRESETSSVVRKSAPIVGDVPFSCQCVEQELNLHSLAARGLRPRGLANAQPTRLLSVTQARVEFPDHDSPRVCCLCGFRTGSCCEKRPRGDLNPRSPP